MTTIRQQSERLRQRLEQIVDDQLLEQAISLLQGYQEAVDALAEQLHTSIAAQTSEDRRVLCAWRETADGYYDTGCGHAFSFEDGTPADNKQSYCGYCGGRLIVAVPQAEE